MPLYEYECKQCHRRVEKIQKFSAPEITICEHCGGELERVISAPAIQFKGSGWYVNDYAKSGGKRPSSNSGEKSADGKGDGKAEPKTDGKAESKSESKPDSGGGSAKTFTESTSSNSPSSGSSGKSE